MIIQLQRLHPLLLQILLPLGRQYPVLRELVPLLGLVVSKVKGHVFERVGAVARFVQQLADGLAEEALVLRLRVKVLAGHFDHVCIGVVARASQFDELVALRREERHVGGSELDDDFVGRRVRFAKVRGVAEAEGGCLCGGFPGAGEFCVLS
jgi:hypothetical protein